MKTWMFALAGLAAAAGAVGWFGAEQGFAQGPGSVPSWDGQAPSELHAFPPENAPAGPASSPSRPNTTPAPSDLANRFSPDAGVMAMKPAASTAVLPSYAGASAAPAVPDPTRDYLVTPAQGPWMICVTYYSGADAPAMAVQLVQELRNTYKLPAYIFNHGAEARRKEMERVLEVVQKHREFLQQMNVTPDPNLKIRVPHVRIEEQCAVLLGGYSTLEAARHNLDVIKKLKTDPKRIKMQNEIFIAEPDAQGKLKTASAIRAPINPFEHVFVVRNPAVPAERPANQDSLDLAVLQKLNAGESFSLLQCPKKFTLAITQLQTPTVVQSQAASSSFLDKLGLGNSSAVKVDAAGQSAHSFAELLRKANLEAYVLHTRFSSVVTVGSYDSMDDPHLKHDQERLSKLHVPPVVRLFPQPMPMPVPH